MEERKYEREPWKVHANKSIRKREEGGLKKRERQQAGARALN